MNVIWITADTFRKDHLGCYGNQTIHTPSLDALAAKSTRFDRHYAGAFPTMPARADFYTGRWSSCFMGWEPMPKGQVTLPQILIKDYHTAAVVDTPFYLRGGMNYDLGFRSFIDVPGQLGSYDMYNEQFRDSWSCEGDRFAARTFTHAMEWLEGHYKEDFFLYIDAWDPHEPWDAPAYYTEQYWPGYDGERIDAPYTHWQDVPGMTEEKVRKAHAAYCGEITMVDTWTGHLLRQVENMGLVDKTAIIFTTDHGFYFGEHDGLFGKTYGFSKYAKARTRYVDKEENWLWGRSPLFEETIACPLLVHVPGAKPGVYEGLTSAVDLMPTVLDILGKEIPDTVEGQSLLPMTTDMGLTGREFVVSMQPFSKPGHITRQVDGRERQMTVESSTTITTKEWALLYSSEPGESWLYHLPSDPEQNRNVAGEHPDVARDLHQYLVKFMRDYNLAPELREPRMALRL